MSTLSARLPMPEALYEQVVDFRRDLHQHPELSWQEERTCGRVMDYLTQLGLAPQRTAGTGVVADIPGSNNDRLVALRADLDALPIVEETGLPFASQTAGRMHACGHDGHTSMLLGAASLLCGGPPPPTRVRLLFQPAEELGEGALAFIAAGALQDVDIIFGGHVDRHYPLGTIVVSDGAVNASSDQFTIRISGRGGHAARPHETVDAVVVGSLMVMAIQTIVSREVNPAFPSVVTVGRFDAGTASNVIAGQASLAGSIRAQHPTVREHLHQSIRRIAQSIAQLHGAAVEVEIDEGTPPLINPVAGTGPARTAAARVVGEDGVRQLEIANMGGEDFSHYLQHVTGCYVRFGTTCEGVTAYPAHSSRFDFDERALAYGAAYFNEVAREAGRRLLSQEAPS